MAPNNALRPSLIKLLATNDEIVGRRIAFLSIKMTTTSMSRCLGNIRKTYLELGGDCYLQSSTKKRVLSEDLN